MSKSSNLIDKIMLGKSRLPEDSDRFGEWFDKSQNIYRAYYHIKDEIDSKKVFRNELLKYIPIGSVACIQGYFSLAIRDIIDYGPPYRDNILKLSKDIKFDMEPILGVFDGKITLGEFISALLPIRNLEVINFYMTSLLDIRFLDKLRNQKITVPDRNSQYSFSDDADKVYADIHKIFEDRHIFCHELAPLKKPKLEETKRLFDNASLFIMATEPLIYSMLSK
ncbi:MAG: hypothetical protein MUP98_03615 [Candidatus Aminicenantes bacterium]|nr:hypothetical protein [Candidatus Aminicenantes bacterium]